MIDAPALIADLQQKLDATADEKTRRFWERYIPGLSWRGVPMAGVRRAVAGLWRRHSHEAEGLRAVAFGLFEEGPQEDRLAGILLLSEYLRTRLGMGAADLPEIAGLFGRGRIDNWSLCDWTCVKFLSPMIIMGGEAEQAAVSAWRTAGPLWQRRASCVAFVIAAKTADRQGREGLSAVIVENCEALVRDPARFAQTGVGWTMRELYLADPAAVIAFAERNIGRLSMEAVRSMAEKMPAAERDRLVGLRRAGGRR